MIYLFWCSHYYIGRLIQPLCTVPSQNPCKFDYRWGEVHFTSQRMIFPQTLVFRQWEAMNTKSYGHYRKYFVDTRSDRRGEPLYFEMVVDPCKESGQCSKGFSLCSVCFDIDTVSRERCFGFLNIFTHGYPFYCWPERKITFTIL